MSAGGRRVIRTSPRYTLMADRGTTYCAVEGIRLREDEVADAIAEVDAFMADTETRIVGWWLTERSTPNEECFVAAGLTIDENDYLHAAMLLTAEPPASDFVARPIANVEEYVAARRLMAEVFANSNIDRTDASFAAEYEHDPDPIFAVWLDGRIASVGRATFASIGVFLSGGATAEWARGRGAYRAVVRARWDAAVEAGTPALAVGGGPLSRPILERLGFEQVLQYRRLQSVRSSG